MTERLSRRAMLGRLSAAAFLAASGCGRRSSQAPNVVHLATAAGQLNTTMSELLRQQRFMESFDLTADVVAMADGGKIVGGIYSGSIDMSPMSGFGQVFPAAEHGADLKIICATTLIPGLALFSAKPNVRSVKDLEGKVVGTGAIGSLVHQLTTTVMRKYAVDVTRVRFVNIGSSQDIFKGVMAGTVDAGTGPAAVFDDAEPYKVHGVEHGNMSVELPEFTYQAGWTSNRMIAAKRDVLVRVLAAYAKLFRFVAQPSSKDAFLAARRAVIPNATEREHLAEWNYLQTFKPFASDLLISPERVRYLQQLNLDFQIQTQMLPFDRVVDMSLAHDALKLLT
jgi:ABC-type nitrate/sulfonate/bicarbonate transport system substrate-binding protein